MKPFKTLEEQIVILEERGLTINDKSKAKRYLLEHSYYKVINVYSKFFQKTENVYLKNATFEEIRLVHIFDTELKSILFKYLIECEKHFKSIVSYRFSEYYRDVPLAYLKTTSYDDENLLQLANSISILSNIISNQIRSKKANAIKHYNSNHNDIPLWVLIDNLTFGQTVHIYTHFDKKLKNNIAKDLAYYLESNLNKKIVVEPKELQNMLFNLIDIRNCVAHNNKLFHFKCKNNLTYSEFLHSPAHIKKNQSRQDLYSNLVTMQLFLDKGQYALLHNTLLKRAKNLNNKLISINIDLILTPLGFPIDWVTKTKTIPQE